MLDFFFTVYESEPWDKGGIVIKTCNRNTLENLSDEVIDDVCVTPLGFISLVLLFILNQCLGPSMVSAGDIISFFFLWLSDIPLLEKDMATHSSILAWRIQDKKSVAGYSTWGLKSRTRLSD